MTATEASAEITIYTLPWCVHCARAKALLTRLDVLGAGRVVDARQSANPEGADPADG